MIITAIKEKIINSQNSPYKADKRPYSPTSGEVLKFRTPLREDVVSFGTSPVIKHQRLKRSTLKALQGTLLGLSNDIIARIKPYQPVIKASGLKKINEAFRAALDPQSEAFKNSVEDLKFILEKDPALKEKDEAEAILYKSIPLTFAHRIAHIFYEKGDTTVARAISEASKELTGAEIHPGVTLGQQIFIDHPSGLVIGETARIGNRFHGHGNVLLGSDGVNKSKHRHPTVGNEVTIWPKANVHGNKKIGDRATVGCGAVITEDVPEGAIVVGRNKLIKLKDDKLNIGLEEYWENQKQAAIV